MRFWLTDLRKTALLHAIGSAAAIAYVAYSQRYIFVQSMTRLPWYLGATGIVGMAVLVLPLAFLIVLYRTNVILNISKRLRLVGLAAAGVVGIQFLRSFVIFVNSARLYIGPLSFQQSPLGPFLLYWSYNLIPAMLEFLFLVALARFRYTGGGSDRAEVRVLSRLAMAGAIVWSLILAGMVVSAIYLTSQYSSWREMAHQSGRGIESLPSLFMGYVGPFLQMAALLVPFYVVWKSLVIRQDGPVIAAGEERIEPAEEGE